LNLVSRDIGLSFLPMSVPRPEPPATQLSSIHGRLAAGAHVYAVRELAGDAGQTSGRANSAVTSGQPAVSETGKTGTVRVPDCQRRFLIAGEKAASRNLRCHGTQTRLVVSVKMDCKRRFSPVSRVVGGPRDPGVGRYLTRRSALSRRSPPTSRFLPRTGPRGALERMVAPEGHGRQ
jgi:hypothetical protein